MEIVVDTDQWQEVICIWTQNNSFQQVKEIICNNKNNKGLSSFNYLKEYGKI